MPNLKEIRNRIVSVGSTMQITSAMKMVSAAKLKKAQDAITQLRPYANKLNELLSNVSGTLDGDVGGAYTQKNDGNNVLFVIITSNRGLCGGFNSSVLKEFKNNLDKEAFKGKHIKVMAIGRKGHDILSKTHEIDNNYSFLWDNLTYDETAKIADELMKKYTDKEFSEIYLVYNHFKNAATQYVLLEPYLPLQMPENISHNNTDYIFEPNKNQIIIDLIPKTLRTQLYKAVLDSQASEHGARMTAMHKATDNADSLRRELILSYNKARQAAITKEILEIVGGAEALAN